MRYHAFVTEIALLTRLALGFGPPEIFALLAVGLAMVTALASRSAIRALVAAVLGMLVAQVGIDPVMGTARFTFGRSEGALRVRARGGPRRGSRAVPAGGHG